MYQAFFNQVRDIQQMLISSFFVLINSPTCFGFQVPSSGVTVSLFKSYSKLSAFWLGVGYCQSGVAICRRQPEVAYK
jgi:hypothetical protein